MGDGAMWSQVHTKWREKCVAGLRALMKLMA